MSQKSYNDEASLYLIPTPIGNLDDITVRSLKTLETVDLLLCEDTRETGKLMKKFNIKKRLVSCHEYNESDMVDYVIKCLDDNMNIGLVTDQGTPIISDPGFIVAREIIKKGYNVISLPGPTAFVPALTMSGINPAPFLFYGFLNSKESRRVKELESLKKLPYTIILYEAPHRIYDMLKSLLEVFGNRRIALCREISKKYEEVIRGTLEEVLEIADTLKGEMVVVVEGNLQQEDFSTMTILEHINLYLEDGMTEKEAIKKVAIERDVPKSVIYREYHINN